MLDVPGYVWVISLAGTAAIATLTCSVLYQGALGAGLGRRRAVALAAGTAVSLAAMFAVSAAIADNGWYLGQPGHLVPWLPLVAATSFLGALAATRIPVVARALSAPDMASRLMLPHVPRVGGLAFLLLMVLGQMPALFALPAGLGDIAVGLTAVFAARRLSYDQDARSALRFNLSGILDLVLALALGAITAFQLLDAPHNNAIAQLPSALVPTVAVPLLLVLHILSIRRLPDPGPTRILNPVRHAAA